MANNPAVNGNMKSILGCDLISHSTLAAFNQNKNTSSVSLMEKDLGSLGEYERYYERNRSK